MKVQGRWLGEAVLESALQAGDLFSVTDHQGSTTLAIKCMGVDGQTPLALVLHEEGALPADPVPRMMHLETIIDPPSIVRNITGHLAIEPAERSAGAALRAVAGSVRGLPLGSLCQYADGRMAVVAATGRDRAPIDIASGERVAGNPPAFLATARWRLLWRDGDDAIELCSFDVAG